MALHVVYRDPGGVGYHPVLHMVRLAAELLEGDLILLQEKEAKPLDRLLAHSCSRSRGGIHQCLLICASPVQLRSLPLIPDWRRSYSRMVAWVFDSFWMNYMPRFARTRRHFDHIFLTEPEDAGAWGSCTGSEVSWLPWGSDVLRLGSANPIRKTDLLRVGRQPAEWEDDVRTERACEGHGLSFSGRPPMKTDASENQRELASAFANTKFTLSFSNRVSPSVQTHPVREYITARWTDALASGATVAGVPPKTEVIEKLLWPEALLPLATTSLEAEMESISQAVRTWTPKRAATNYAQSLKRLDWRWRFRAISEVLGLKPAKLNAELAQIEQKAADTLARASS